MNRKRRRQIAREVRRDPHRREMLAHLHGGDAGDEAGADAVLYTRCFDDDDETEDLYCMTAEQAGARATRSVLPGVEPAADGATLVDDAEYRHAAIRSAASGKWSRNAERETDELEEHFQPPSERAVDLVTSAFAHVLHTRTEERTGHTSAAPVVHVAARATTDGRTIGGRAAREPEVHLIDVPDASQVHARMLACFGESDATVLPRNIFADPFAVVGERHGISSHIRSSELYAAIVRTFVPLQLHPFRALHTDTYPIVARALAMGVHPVRCTKLERGPYLQLEFQMMERLQDADAEKEEFADKVANARGPDGVRFTLVGDSERDTFMMDNLRLNLIVCVHHVEPEQWPMVPAETLCPHVAMLGNRAYDNQSSRAKLFADGKLTRVGACAYRFSYECFFFTFVA